MSLYKSITYYAFSDNALREGYFYKVMENWEGPDDIAYYAGGSKFAAEMLDALPPGLKENYKRYSQRDANELSAFTH